MIKKCSIQSYYLTKNNEPTFFVVTVATHRSTKDLSGRRECPWR